MPITPQELISNLGDLPPLPQVAAQVLRLAADPESTMDELQRVVATDQALAAQILKIANSAMFGRRCEVTSLFQAIVLLGLDRVRTMATLVAINKMVRSSIRIANLRKVWRHSLITALIAEEAAHRCGVDRESAYTAGLLHNLGTLGLMSAYPDSYARLLEVSNEYAFELLKTERDLFEIDHCAAGAYLAQDWNFPDELAAALATHHDEPVAGERSLDNLIKVSWRLTDTLGYAAFCPDREWEFEQLIDFLPSARSSWLGRSPETAKEELDQRLASAGM